MGKIICIIIAVIVALLSVFSLTDLRDTFSQVLDEITDYFSAEVVPETPADLPLPVSDASDVPQILEDTEPITEPVIEDDIQKYNPLEYMEETGDFLRFGYLVMAAPEGYSIESDVQDDGIYFIHGTDVLSGGEFKIAGVADNGYTAASRLDDLSEALGNIPITEINGVPCIIFYDDANDADMCICADLSNDNLYIIAFNRPNGENTAQRYFDTLGALILDE